MDTGIRKVIKDGNGSALVYTALLAAIVANCTPTPADALFFMHQQRDKERLEKGEITPTTYWRKDAFGYYFYTAAWYTALFGLFYAVNGEYKNQTKALIGLLSAGLVVGVIAKNIQKDNAIAEATKIQSQAMANDKVGK